MDDRTPLQPAPHPQDCEAETPEGVVRAAPFRAQRSLRRANPRRSRADRSGAADAELERRLEIFASALEDAPEPVLVIDRDGRLRYINPPGGALVGAPREAVLGRPVAEWVATRTGGHAGGGEPGAVLRGSFDLRRGDGETRVVSWSASPLRVSEGRVVGVVVFLRDETQRRQEEARWSRRQDELEQTLRAVAHDLRSPLVSVLGFSRLLGEEFGSALGERGTHYIERITEAGRTMESLIRELLDFTRIGHAGERRVLVDPCVVLAQIQRELKPRLDAQRVELAIDSDLPLLHCDRMRLYQLCSNLIGNALDHMGAADPPRIEVTVREDGPWHRLTVRDHGRGIPPGEQERIFAMFHSVPREGGRRGTGIGLAIVKKIAELHGGRVWVESAPGAGAAFHVQLPRP